MDTAFTIDADGQCICTLQEFLENNQEGLEESEIEAIKALKVGESFGSGGGAWATWTVKRVS